MGGHGGLNILPQKRWNVYNFDNREKVRKDEEAAARDEQLQRDEARKRDAQLRLDRLRTSRGLAPLKRPSPEAQNGKEEEEVSTESEESEPKSGHINLFQGIKIFDVVQVPKNEEPAEEEDKSRKKMRKEAAAAARAAAREAEGREFSADDEKYRLGYGVAGKGVKLPWYLERRKGEDVDEDGEGWRVKTQMLVVLDAENSLLLNENKWPFMAFTSTRTQKIKQKKHMAVVITLTETIGFY